MIIDDLTYYVCQCGEIAELRGCDKCSDEHRQPINHFMCEACFWVHSLSASQQDHYLQSEIG